MTALAIGMAFILIADRLGSTTACVMLGFVLTVALT
jgi:hypothetical protein